MSHPHNAPQSGAAFTQSAADPIIFDGLTGDLARLNGRWKLVCIGDGWNGIDVEKIKEEAAKRQQAPHCGRLGRAFSSRGSYLQATGEATAAVMRECKQNIPALAAIDCILEHIGAVPEDSDSDSDDGSGSESDDGGGSESDDGSGGRSRGGGSANGGRRRRSRVRLVEAGVKGDSMLLNFYGSLLPHRHNEGGMGNFYHSTAAREQKRDLDRVALIFSLDEDGERNLILVDQDRGAACFGVPVQVGTTMCCFQLVKCAGGRQPMTR